jgi:hypothetical protein
LSQAKEEIIVAEPVSDAESDDDRRIKRQLPSTVTPERVSTKKIHKTEEENEHSKKKAGGIPPDKTCRKTLFSENPISIDTTETTTPANQKALQNDEFIDCFCNIETICDKEGTQIKIVIVYPNGNATIKESFDELTKGIIKNLALKNWKPAANQVFKHPELKSFILEAAERAVSEEFDNLSKSDTILKGRKVDEVIAFSTKILVHETSLMCPLWYACVRGACGKKWLNSPNPFKSALSTNKMALVTAALARLRNPTLSAFAYRISTILFHSGTKYNDILRLSRLGICMSPESTVHFQRQLGENFDAKVQMWKKTTEDTLSAINMLQTIKCQQVGKPVLEADDMEITRTINVDEKMIKAYPKVDPNAFAYCDTVLHNIMTKKEQTAIDSDTLEDAIDELQHTNLPTFK